MKKGFKKIIDILEANYISYDFKDNECELEFYTDTAGQDVLVYLEYNGTAKDFVEKFTEYAADYDVEEEVIPYIPYLGKNGVPSSIYTLLDDFNEIKETLEDVAIKLNAVVR